MSNLLAVGDELGAHRTHKACGVGSVNYMLGVLVIIEAILLLLLILLWALGRYLDAVLRREEAKYKVLVERLKRARLDER